MGAARPCGCRPRGRWSIAAGVEGDDDESRRGLVAKERRALQRSDDARRTLGPRRVSKRRCLADRVAVRQRSEISHRRLHDEHALQTRSERIEIQAAIMQGTLMRRIHLLTFALLAIATATPIAQGPPPGPPMVELVGSWAMVND